MKYQVKLKYFQQEDSELWGFTHVNTVDKFDPFYEAAGIFHDVFEHYFEGTGYFKDDGFCNLFGEMVATGHKFYITNMLGVDCFKYRLYHRGISDWTVDTRYILFDYLKNDYCDYPVEGLNIPYQKPIDNSFFEQTIDDYVGRIKDFKSLKHKSYICKQIRRAYRFGYRMAQKKWGISHKVTEMLDKFLLEWFNIMRLNDKESILIEGSDYGLNYIIFNVDTRRPSCTMKLVDEVGNIYPVSKLTSY